MEKAKLPVAFVLPGLGRFAYHRSTINSLCAAGYPVYLIFCKGRTPENPSDELRRICEEFERFLDRWPDLKFIPLGERGQKLRLSSEDKQNHNKVERLRFLRTYARYLMRGKGDDAYGRRWLKYMPEDLRTLCQKGWFRRLLGTELAFHYLTWRELRFPPSGSVKEWLKSLEVRAVVASPAITRNAPEAEFLKAGRALGIPTAVAVMSWDSLTTKGLIPFPPDAVLAWNAQHREQAIQLHGIPPDKILVTGAPFFDRWQVGNGLQDTGPTGRTAAQGEYILYLGSSKNIAENEGWLVRQVAEQIGRDERTRHIRLHVRPHPGNKAMCDEIRGVPNVRVLSSEVPFTEDAIRRLHGEITSALCTVGINTSGMVDAVILGKHCLSIRTDRYLDTHLQADHFLAMLDTGAIELVDSVASLVDRICSIRGGDDPAQASRRRFLREYIRSRDPDRLAGEITAAAIGHLAEGKTCPEIDALLTASAAARS